MGKIRLSLALMLLAALVVVLAGWHQARRIEVDRIEIDRNLLMTFSDEFEKQVTAVEKTTLEELLTLTTALDSANESQAKELLGKIPSARAAYLFRDSRQLKSWALLGSVGDPSLPDVTTEDGKSPLVPETAILLTKQFFEETIYGTSGWVHSADKQHLLFWSSSIQGNVTSVLLITNRFVENFAKKVRDTSHAYYEPIQQSGEMITLDTDQGHHLFGEPAISSLGPPSMVRSIDFPQGRFWLRGWNRKEQTMLFHWPTMMTAGLISLSLAGAGAFLYVSQSRAWRESQQRVSFANRVSHELGTPLTNMTLNLELAARSLRSQPEAAGKRLEKVHEEVGRLSRLVTNVLGYSKEDGQKHPTLCSPDQVIEDVLAQFRPALERRGMEISWQPNVSLEGMLDRDALSQIVWNLISNVEKYAATGKWLGLTTAHQDNRLIVEVQDRGPGIPPSQRQRIFQAFERIHESTTEGVSGTGLGLTISRDLARTMGGTLQILSSDSGAKFRLTLPFETV